MAKDISDKERTLRMLERSFRSFEKHKCYEILGFKDTASILEYVLKKDVNQIFENKIDQQKIVQARALNPAGLNQDGVRYYNSNRCNPDKQGNSAAYLTARIKRDHPEILKRMIAGEFKSVRQAAIEAGIVKIVKTATFYPDDLERTKTILEKHFPGVFITQ